ncbi:FecR family protein [soil metagenome]
MRGGDVWVCKGRNMTKAEAMIDAQALDWVIRTRDPDFTDWVGFTAWLEADPARASAYDRLMADDADLPALMPATPTVPVPANDPGWRRWRWPAIGAVAAALVAVVTIGVSPRADPYTVSTPAGQPRALALSDGTRIAMNGGTTLRLDRAAPRLVVLDQGEATFTVTHDASHPFRVTVGKAVFEDVGTVFNISRAGEVTRIGVAEGAVLFNPDAQGIALLAGRGLRVAGDAVSATNVSPQAVASWREGRLVYDNAPMADIASDIARNLGIVVQTAPGLASARFTGTIMIDRNPDRFFATAGPLLGVSAEHEPTGWLLKGRDATKR